MPLSSVSGNACCRYGFVLQAAGAAAPVDDLGLVDGEAVVVTRMQARTLADRAVDVGDGAALPADDVVVVVSDPQLVASR